MATKYISHFDTSTQLNAAYKNLAIPHLALVDDPDMVKIKRPIKPITYEMVDLGLESGTLWANKNVGAQTIYDTGNYYQFLSTEIPDSYSPNNSLLPWTNNTENAELDYDEYNTLYPDGIWEGGWSGKVKAEYDIAYNTMGNIYCMPTYDQVEELYLNTTKTIETINGKTMYKLTSNINGNFIYFPANGYYKFNELNNANNFYILEAGCFSGYVANIYILTNDSDTGNILSWMGMGVRGVQIATETET